MTEKSSNKELKRRVQELETDCLHLEKKLHEARSLTEEIMTYMSEGLVLTNTRGTVIFINQRLSEMLGYLPEQIIGKCWLDMVPVENQTIAQEAEARRAQGHTDRYEIILHHKNGHKFPVLIGAGPRFDKQSGEFIGTMGVVSEIAERKRAEEKLKESKKKYHELSTLFRLMADNMPDMLWAKNLKKEFIFANKAICNNLLNAKDTKEPLGKTDIFFAMRERNSHPENPEWHTFGEICRDSDSITLEALKPMQFDEFGNVKGKFLFLDVHKAPIYDDSGQLIGVVGSARDITETKKAENQLRKLSQAIEQSPVSVVITDLQGKIEYVNTKFTEVTGYSLEEVRGKNPRVLKSGHQPSEHYKELWETISASKTWRGEFYNKKKNGEFFWEAASISPIINNEGKNTHYLAFTEDISERKRMEEALRLSEMELRQLFQESPLSTMLFDKDTGDLVDVNAAALNAYGCSTLEELRVYDFWCDPPYSLADALEWNQKASEEGPQQFQWLSRKISGEFFWEDVFLRRLDIQGKQRIIAVSVDITEKKRIEEEKEKLQTQLNQAQKMESVGRLAGGVAHDFNNMLGVILGHTELALLQTDENHDLYSALNEIQKAARRSADLTKQLLTFARKEIISPIQLDLNKTVESMLNMLRRIIGEDIYLVWRPASHLWPVKMDPTQIDQILANLCINAQDAIAGVGKLIIETGIKTFDEEYCNKHPGFIPGDFVLLTVSDNGCGMDKDTLDNLFEPFFTTKEVGKGTGLGLATVYGIVKQNNGFIKVYSEPGHGSTFKIYLPRLVTDVDTDMAAPEKKSAAGGTETILLVEDEPSVLRMTRMMLERKGYTVLPAATPAEAMEKAKNHSSSIDLLMTDVVMPEMNGRDLAEEITGLYPGIRLLFMSGYTANAIVHQGVLDDGVAFIQKPFSIQDMTAKIRELLDMAPDKHQG